MEATWNLAWARKSISLRMTGLSLFFVSAIVMEFTPGVDHRSGQKNPAVLWQEWWRIDTFNHEIGEADVRPL